MTKLLFICSANLQRSPTAADLFRDCKGYEARSAGTHPLAVQQVNQDLIEWADVIFVMNEKIEQHKSFLQKHFSIANKPIHDLDILDRYPRGDPTLAHLIIERVKPHLDISHCLESIYLRY